MSQTITHLPLYLHWGGALALLLGLPKEKYRLREPESENSEWSGEGPGLCAADGKRTDLAELSRTHDLCLLTWDHKILVTITAS